FEDAMFLAGAAAGTGTGMDDRKLDPSAVGFPWLERDRFTTDRADPVADAAGDAAEIETGLVTHDDGDAHVRVADALDFAVKRARWTGLGTRHILAHEAGRFARSEERRSQWGLVTEGGEFKCIEGASLNAQSAADTFGEELILPHRAWWPQGAGISPRRCCDIRRQRAPGEAGDSGCLRACGKHFAPGDVT